MQKLIYFEAYPDPRSAIEREKQLKRWRREKKESLIAKSNPDWSDLGKAMFSVVDENAANMPVTNPRGPSTSLRSARDDGD